MSRTRLSVPVGVVVSTVSVAAVVWWILRQDTPRLPGGGERLLWLVGSLALTAVAYVLRGWRWHRVMRLSAIEHRPADAYALTVVAYGGNNVLPARGGDLLKVAVLGPRSGARRREILGSVVAERLLDAGALAVVFVVLTWAGIENAPAGQAPAFLLAAAFALAAVFLASYLALRRRGRFERFAARVRPVAHSSKLFVRAAGVPLAAVSVAIWFIEGLNLLLIARSLDVDLSLLEAVLTMVLASLAAAIPAAPGYAGTYDAGLLLGLGAASIHGGTAVGVLLLARFMLFVPVTIVALGVMVVRYGGLHLRERRLRLRTADVAP